jgi:hypothetical protein
MFRREVRNETWDEKKEKEGTNSERTVAFVQKKRLVFSSKAV